MTEKNSSTGEGETSETKVAVPTKDFNEEPKVTDDLKQLHREMSSYITGFVETVDTIKPKILNRKGVTGRILVRRRSRGL